MEAMVLHSTTKILTLVYSRHCEWQFLEEVHLLLRADQSGGVSPRFIFSSLYSLYSFYPCLCASHVFPLPLSLCLPFISFFLVFVSLMYSFCLCLCLCLPCVMRVFACVLVCVCVSLAFFVFVFSWWPDLLFYCCCVCFSLPANYNLWQGWTWTMVWGTAIMRMEWTLKRPAFANPAPFLRCQSYLQPLKSN